MGKVVIEGNRVTVVEAAIDIVSKFLNCAMKKRLTWYKGEGMEGSVVPNPDVQVVLNLIKLCVRVAGKRWLAKLPHQRVKNYCAWNASAR